MLILLDGQRLADVRSVECPHLVVTPPDSLSRTGAIDGGACHLRRLALPKSVRQWSLTTLKEKLVKIGAKVTRHAKYLTFELAEVAVPRQLFAAIFKRIGRLRQSPTLCRSG